MIKIQDVQFSYKAHQALKEIDLEIQEGEIFGFLGPNGSGKTTLFKLLSTLYALQSGHIEMGEWDYQKDFHKVRSSLGVVFQSPSLDLKLTVAENLKCHGHTYGYSGKELHQRMDEVLDQMGLKERQKELVETLSGGLQRRLELAKGLFHRPRVLLLDEPSNGLDPGARIDLWQCLKDLKASQNVTILIATHLMEEADQCDRLAIMSEGKIAALGNVSDLKSNVGVDRVLVYGDDLNSLADAIKDKFQLEGKCQENALLYQHPEGHRFVTELTEAFPDEVQSALFRKPSLEDVFVFHTGHQFWNGETE